MVLYKLLDLFLLGHFRYSISWQCHFFGGQVVNIPRHPKTSQEIRWESGTLRSSGARLPMDLGPMQERSAMQCFLATWHGIFFLWSEKNPSVSACVSMCQQHVCVFSGDIAGQYLGYVVGRHLAFRNLSTSEAGAFFFSSDPRAVRRCIRWASQWKAVTFRWELHCRAAEMIHRMIRHCKMLHRWNICVGYCWIIMDSPMNIHDFI